MNEEVDRNDITQKNKALPANTKNTYYVTSKDLPLSCPLPEMELWNSHPRVYLPIEDTGEAKCPYCGAKYVLSDAVMPDK
jgi:uncharacterized Zn-finger protein